MHDRLGDAVHYLVCVPYAVPLMSSDFIPTELHEKAAAGELSPHKEAQLRRQLRDKRLTMQFSRRSIGSLQ